MGERSRMDRARDVLAWRMCNLILYTIATPWYRRNARRLLKLGLTAAAMLSRQPDEDSRERIQARMDALKPGGTDGAETRG